MQKIGVNKINYKHRIGEKFITSEGYKIEIINYLGVNNCTIQFEDGVIMNGLQYHTIVKGGVRKPVLGNVYITREGYEITIVEYINKLNCTVEFKNGYKLKNTILQNVKKGLVKNPYHKTLYGVGFLGSGKYSSSINGRNTEIYKKWRGMFSRCYDSKVHKRQPKYKQCYVDERWHNFQNFAQWYEENYNPETMQGWHLDKDILVKGNKIYSPETCCFVPSKINSNFTTKKNTKYFYFRDNNYEVSVFNKYIGRFKTLEEAFEAYKTVKEKHIKEIADEWRDLIDPRVYEAMYNYEVEIND